MTDEELVDSLGEQALQRAIPLRRHQLQAGMAVLVQTQRYAHPLPQGLALGLALGLAPAIWGRR
jgi:hypothetical protein